MRILEIADLHNGSAVSPAHPKSEANDDGNVVGLSPVQEKTLNPVWKELCKQKPYDLVVVNGDATEGQNKKDNIGGVWCSSIDLQAKNAALLLSEIPLTEKGKFVLIGGTPYHVGSNISADQKVATYLASEHKINAKYMGLEFLLRYGDNKIHHCHWSSGGFYEGTFLNREIIWSYIYKHDITGLVRAHLHHYHEDSDGSRFGLLLPGWKVADNYVKTKGFRFGRGQIGWVDLDLTETDCTYTPHLFTFKDKFKEVRL
jgi:hypothetical protein